MVGGPAQGFARRSGGGTVLRSGENFAIAHASIFGVAVEDSRPVHDNTTFSSGQLCKVIRHRCGMLGVRVGEASHRPPVLRRLCRNRNALFEISSDEEPLIQCIGTSSCDSGVFCQMTHRLRFSFAETVPASQAALIQAGRLVFSDHVLDASEEALGCAESGVNCGDPALDSQDGGDHLGFSGRATSPSFGFGRERPRPGVGCHTVGESLVPFPTIGVSE